MERDSDGGNERGIVKDGQNHTTVLINVENDLVVNVVLVAFELLVDLRTDTFLLVVGIRFDHHFVTSSSQLESTPFSFYDYSLYSNLECV